VSNDCINVVQHFTNLDISPPHTNLTLHGFAQKPFHGIESFVRLLEDELVSPEESGDEDLEFHIGQVLTDARPRSIRERIECLLNLRLILFKESLWPERLLSIVAPDILISMNGVTRHAEDRTRREELSTDV